MSLKASFEVSNQLPFPLRFFFFLLEVQDVHSQLLQKFKIYALNCCRNSRYMFSAVAAINKPNKPFLLQAASVFHQGMEPLTKTADPKILCISVVTE